MKKYINASLDEAKTALENLINDEKIHNNIEMAANLMIESLKNNFRIFSCGNGGSMSDAIHFAEELSGRYRKNRNPLAAMAISDPGHISCVSNDFGYQYIFSRFLEAHGRTNDCLLAISTSGKSPNIINAAITAKKKGMHVISLTGKQDSELSKVSDVDISSPAGQYADRVQELHIKIIHILIELIERYFFPDNY